MSTDTIKVFKAIAPAGGNSILSGVDNALKLNAAKFGLNTPKRMAAFLAQAAHETAGFKTLREYGPDAYFLRYEGRRDLGNIFPGDGLKFKGRGIFQITGRANYKTISLKLFNDLRLINKPELLEQPYNATLSALYFWDLKKLNSFADSDDFLGMSKKINGFNKATGLPNGWQDRQKLFALAMKAITIFNPVLFLANYADLKKKGSNFFNAVYINWLNNATQRIK